MILKNNTSATIYESFCIIHPGENHEILDSGEFNIINVRSDKGDCTIIKNYNVLEIQNHGKLVATREENKNGMIVVAITDAW